MFGQYWKCIKQVLCELPYGISGKPKPLFILFNVEFLVLHLRICASPAVHSAGMELVLGCWLGDHELGLGWPQSPAWARPGLFSSTVLAYPQDRLRADRLWDGAGIIPSLQPAANSRVGCSGSSGSLLKAGFRHVQGGSALPQRPCNLQGAVFFSCSGTLMRRCCETNCNLWHLFCRGGKIPPIDLWKGTFLFFFDVQISVEPWTLEKNWLWVSPLHHLGVPWERKTSGSYGVILSKVKFLTV